MAQDVTGEQIESILSDGTYLQDEAEALKYVIDTIPYDYPGPDDDASILDKLLFLDHLQVNYYRPVFEQAGFGNIKNLKVRDYDSFHDEFSTDHEEKKDIQKVLGKLSKHRAALINIFKKIPLIDWDANVYRENRIISLYDLAQDLIRHDRMMLKEIAEMVLMFQKDMQSRRELRSQSAYE